MMPKINIQNVVSVVKTEQSFDLDTIGRILAYCIYQPSMKCLIYKPRRHTGTFLIFRSGKIVYTGGPSESYARIAPIRLLEIIENNGIVILKKPRAEIVNIVATTNLDGKLNIEKIAQTLEKVIYEPEQFPALIYRLNEPKTTFLIFPNGKLVCTGAKSEKDVTEAINRVFEIFQEKNFITSNVIVATNGGTPQNYKWPSGGNGKSCSFFPCHKGIDENSFDCRFCYCPFYPCLDRQLGRLTPDGYWDCSDCMLPHIPEIADYIRYLEDHLFEVVKAKYLKYLNGRVCLTKT
jgi:transcription initiation factor TFIID TATA-box-binding protein